MATKRTDDYERSAAGMDFEDPIRERAASIGASIAENGPGAIFEEIENLLPDTWREQIRTFPITAMLLGLGVGVFLGMKKSDEIIAAGRYYLDPKTNRAEVAFVVRDQWQNRGIGTFMLRWLTTIARANGIAGFTAEVLRENKRMQSVFNHSEYRVRSRPVDGVRHFEIDF